LRTPDYPDRCSCPPKTGCNSNSLPEEWRTVRLDRGKLSNSPRSESSYGGSAKVKDPKEIDSALTRTECLDTWSHSYAESRKRHLRKLPEGGAPPPWYPMPSGPPDLDRRFLY